MIRPLLGLTLLAGCVTPLSNKIDVGNEAFVVVVARGADGNQDLFAAPAEGGTFRQLTFTRTPEDLPRLSPTGTGLLFVRGPAGAAKPVVMALLDGTEASAPLPADAGAITRDGWLAGGDTVVVATERGLWWSAAAGPLTWVPVPDDRRAAADSATRELIGDPVFAEIAACRGAAGLCVTGPAGETPLGPGAREAFRWGGKAVGYLIEDRLEVRPLGGGRLRQPTWRDAPAAIRHATYHPGSSRQSP
ncbi:MAG: TolB family protein [Gemmatimonadales bacterium]